MKNVIVVGVGALGSHVVQFLRNEAKLNVVDFDHVEAKNTLSQFHSKMNVGKLKSPALMGLMKLTWGINIGVNTNKLFTENVTQILGARIKAAAGDPNHNKIMADLVIDCLDNGTGRRVIQEYVRGVDLPCLHGALAADAAFGRSCWDKHFVIDSEAGAGAPTCEGGEHLPFVAIVAGYIARSAQIFLRTGRQVGFEISPAGAVST